MIRLFCAALLLSTPAFLPLDAQLLSAPTPQPASVVGVVTDTDDAAIPTAKVSLLGSDGISSDTTIVDSTAAFQISGLPSSIAVRLIVTAPGFADWTSPTLNLIPGSQLNLTNIKLKIASVDTAVDAVFADQLAIKQVKAEEQQRVFGFIPNFYVSYDQTFVPLKSSLKFKLAARGLMDPVTFASAAFVGGIEQAADSTAYVQGAKGYGQRVGAVYANGATDILIGGAILPSLLHQDPRYFYMGYGTKKQRTLHALSAPFICKGDNGRTQINFSSIGGDLASSSLSNIYYRPTDRGAGLVFDNTLLETGGRMLSALAEEFLLSRFTTRAKN
jgi:hypothetical protein